MKFSTAYYILQLLPLSSWAFSIKSLDDHYYLSSRSSTSWTDAPPQQSFQRTIQGPHHRPSHNFKLNSSAEDKTSLNNNLTSRNFADVNQNRTYIEGLLQNLSASLDRWIITGSAGNKQQAFNIMRQIQRESVDEELFKQAIRMAERASVPMTDFKNEYQIRNHNDDDDDNGDDNDDYSASKRKEEAEKRKVWEDQRSSSVVGKNTGGGGGGG
jgi:hypothetical protein